MTEIKAKFYDILVAPVFTEKASRDNENSKYTFKVAGFANKGDIKQAVEVLFSVKVKQVNVSNTQKKRKVFKGRIGERASYKKAIVTLVAGQTIDLGIGA